MEITRPKPNYKELPVYAQKSKILDAIQNNQVIIIQSPTGSGKTTQIPVILHEAGFSENGIIGVTQPRRIAALSVSEFIAKQLQTNFPGLVGYKMRFEDKTDLSTKIKIMTDGILLQEMKLDPYLSKYSVIIIDEAHERSLNIDFILGLLKRILRMRKDFKVIVSSATMNAEAFSVYFEGCPVISIDTETWPVDLIYDPLPQSTTQSAAFTDMLLEKVESIVYRIFDNKHKGDILIFLPGEKIIKDLTSHLYRSALSKELFIIPLYGRLSKEEQEKVFYPTPPDKTKVVIATNIAETSITIDGITTVIDSGLAKINYYNPQTFTSSLNETLISKASCNQRRGRAGRTQAGVCYRLYSRNDYDRRSLYTLEEIYRTDLSEVVLRMSELGITDFESFDFIAPPNPLGLESAIETLFLLGALEKDYSLSAIGKHMVEFPLMPRHSRIIVEAMVRYPSVMEEVLIATAFLSAQSPFILPQGEEMDARRAHHRFRNPDGDFLSYIHIFRLFTEAKNQELFCEKSYLDHRVMSEIVNIKIQLEQIVSDLGFPILSGGSRLDYLTSVASGLIQFICFNHGRGMYRSFTQENIQIHPGSNMFKEEPAIFVAGEVFKTTKMFAMSVSPISKEILNRLNIKMPTKQVRGKEIYEVKKSQSQKGRQREAQDVERQKQMRDENIVRIGPESFELKKIKGKKILNLPLTKFSPLVQDERYENRISQLADLRGCLLINYKSLLSGEKISLIAKLVKELNLSPLPQIDAIRNKNFYYNENPGRLIDSLSYVLRVTEARAKTKELGFITLYSNDIGNYWYKISRGFSTALNESLASVENLIAKEDVELNSEQKTILNATYRKLSSLYT
ncbi:MAG TPA: ATP-dependent RNA helicase [Treponemataceae bacterium]|nr:ATP-dependent RNA helicase [Treponemataceae bacterium]HPM05485.1 ATP-dependent RNA helicase [Treponemataceae bacterium]